MTKVSQVDEVSEVIDSLHKTPSYVEVGIPMLRVTDIKSGSVSTDNCKLVDNETYTEFSKRYVPSDGDIVITRVGSYGNVAYVGDQNFCLGQNTAAIVPKSISPRYLYYVLSSPFGKAEIENLVVGSTQKTLSLKAIKSLPVPRHGVGHEKAIARVLGTLDDKIELNHKMNQTLEEIAKAIFKSWFVDFDPVRAKGEGRPTGLPPEISDLFPDELVDSEIGEIPKGWSPSVAGDLFDCLDRKRIPLSGNDRAKRQGSIPYYGATGIIDHVDDHIFDGTYLLIGEDGSVEKEDGTAFSQYVSGKIWVNNHAHVLIGKGSISTELLYLAFQFVKVSPFVTGAVQLKISQTNLRSIPIISPPPEIGRQFQRIVAPMFDRRLLLEKENLCLAELRDTLLPKLISGELRVPDTEKFLEEAGI